MENDTVKIYVNLLEEGTPTMRPTFAEIAGEGLYRLLPTPDYNPEDEIWEFTPGTIVKCKEAMGFHSGKILLAYQAA